MIKLAILIIFSFLIFSCRTTEEADDCEVIAVDFMEEPEDLISDTVDEHYWNEDGTPKLIVGPSFTVECKPRYGSAIYNSINPKNNSNNKRTFLTLEDKDGKTIHARMKEYIKLDTSLKYRFTLAPDKSIGSMVLFGEMLVLKVERDGKVIYNLKYDDISFDE